MCVRCLGDHPTVCVTDGGCGAGDAAAGRAGDAGSGEMGLGGGHWTRADAARTGLFGGALTPLVTDGAGTLGDDCAL